MTGAALHGLEITGYFPGVIGRITETHAVYYHENWGFDASFETQVGRELSEFIGELRMGFRVCEEHDIRQWGQDIKEQMFELVF